MRRIGIGGVLSRSQREATPLVDGQRSTVRTVALVLISSVLLAQQPPLTREYIRLGGRVVAIENASQAVVLNPTFSPGSGNYSTAQTVQITTGTPNALIRYTIDGTTPT